MNVGQAEFAPRSNKLEDQINSFSYGMKFSYPQYLGRVIVKRTQLMYHILRDSSVLEHH